MIDIKYKGNTLDALKDEIGQRLYKKKHEKRMREFQNLPFLDQLKQVGKYPNKDDLTYLDRVATQKLRRNKLKHDAKVAGGMAITGAAVLSGVHLLNKRKKMNEWKSKGCNNIANSSERKQCEKYISKFKK